MYYITNEKGWLLAADSDFLNRAGVTDIETLQRRIVTGEFALPREETATFDDVNYRARRTAIQSLMGVWYIVHFTPEDDAALTAPQSERFSLVEDESEEELLEKLDLLDISEAESSEEETTESSVLSSDATPKEKETEKTGTSQEETVELFDLSDLIREESPADTPSEKTDDTPVEEKAEETQDDLIDLLLPTEGEHRVDSLEEEARQTEESEKTKLVSSEAFDARSHAESIGVELDDYLQFLKEYRQMVGDMKTALLSEDDHKRLEAADKLLHLANVLQLSEAAELLEKLKESPSEKLYGKLERIIAYYLSEEPEKPTDTSDVFDLDIDTNKATPEEKNDAEYLYDTIDLSDVKPIHFDFTIEEAANDLSLPTELIEEFIHDFIKQAHEETERMIEAYRKGDLETVQKIGHLLKGTSSNLRITPLADTLYEIQFNDDIERVPELVRNYWGHFLSLENQMQLLEQSKS